MNANAGTSVDETKQPSSRKSDAERSVVYRPAGATEDMTLTMAYVRGFLTTPTKQGHKPTEADIIKFMEVNGFELVAKSEINANPKDSANWPDGVWTLPPALRFKDVDRAKYDAIGETDRMTLLFKKRP
jgi:hypothetical protein